MVNSILISHFGCSDQLVDAKTKRIEEIMAGIHRMFR